MSIVLTDDFLRPPGPLTDREESTVKTPTDLWTDEYAVKVAVQDFSRAEQYRTQNCDWRWRTHNELYQAWVQQKFWEGTRIPRASIGIYVAFEQIESMLPKIMAAIFADNPWFQADPLHGTTAEQARAWGSLIAAQMDETDVREVFRRTIKSSLQYGDGIMKLSWLMQKKERLEWLPKMQQRDSMFGGPPQFERVLSKQKVSYTENRPVLEWVDMADFYVDANAFSPLPKDARYMIHRRMVSVDDLVALRGSKPYSIPGDDVLIQMARYKSTAQADSTKASEEQFRLGAWYPINDTTVDPAGRRVEILEYQTDDRVVLVANRSKAILNMPNPYGFKTFYHAFYADVLGRFYSMGVCDVVEGEQRLQQSLINGRLDELSLALHRPMIKKLGIKTPTYSLRVRPGQIWEAEDPSKDYQFLKIDNITANAYVENQASELRVQKTTGMSDIFAQGVASSGGNSANRTATGIGQQAQAGSERIRYLVENLEDTFIEPCLNDVVTLNKMFPPIGTSMADMVALTKIQLSMRASAKMQSRASLMQTFPLFFQVLPALVPELAKVGQTVDFKEIMNMLLDVTGYRNRADIVRQLTPQEQQMMNKPPAEALIKAQLQKAKMDADQKKNQLQLQADNEAAQRDMDSKKMELGLERQEMLDKLAAEKALNDEKLASEKAMNELKLAFEREKMDLELGIRREELQASGAEAQKDRVMEMLAQLMQQLDGEETVTEVQRDSENNLVSFKKKRTQRA